MISVFSVKILWLTGLKLMTISEYRFSNRLPVRKWETTVSITDDTIEYKFSYDAWSGEETLDPNSNCTKTDGQFTNRILGLSGDTILPAVCWEACVSCDLISVSEESLVDNLSIFPNPASSEVFVNGNLQSNVTHRISIVDVTGKTLVSRTIQSNVVAERFDVDGLANGLYLVRIENNHSFRVEKVMIQKQTHHLYLFYLFGGQYERIDPFFISLTSQRDS